MTPLTVIILVGREERHIARCLRHLAPLAPQHIVVVESQHGDRTHEIAVETAQLLKWNNSPSPSPTLTLLWHDWPGTQARQFNWTLDYLEEQAKITPTDLPAWILRLDADEYLTDETTAKLADWLNGSNGSIDDNVWGMTLELKRKFFGGEIRHATNGIRQVRLFRRGKARYDEGLMDERLLVGRWSHTNGHWHLPPSPNQTISQSPNPILSFPGAFYDDSLMTLSEWKEKHHGYAKREAEQAIEGMKTGKWTDPRKAKYYRLPPYLRAILYFCIRYFVKGGFLDGRAGWLWNFYQALWYRCLVDKTIGKLKKKEVVRGEKRSS